jgi:hypothetical protein
VDGFAVEPDRLKSASRRYDDVRQMLVDLHAAHSAALAEIGNCWGGDEPGAAFHQRYCPSAVATLLKMDPSQTGSSTDVARAIADGTYRWAQNYHDVEELVRDSTPRTEWI